MSNQPESVASSKSLDRPTWVRHEVLGYLTLAAAIAYLTRNAVSVSESTIRQDLSLSLRQSGWFMAAFFWSYAALQVPSGMLAHLLSARLAMVLFAGGWSVAAVCIGVAPALWVLIGAQLLMGAAQAGIFPVSCFAISHWTPISRRSFACGVLAVGMQVGAIVASMTTGTLIDSMDWRWVFFLFAIPGFLWSISFYLHFRDHPNKDPKVNEQEKKLIAAERSVEQIPSTENVATPWGLILSSTTLWLLCGQQICRAAGYMFFASWFPTFLQQTRGVSVKDSGYLQALVFVGTLAGSLFGGILTDWIWRRTGSLKVSRSGVGAAFLFGCAILILMAWFVKSTILAVVLLSIGSFMAAMAGPCAIAATIDIGGDHVPQVYGIMNMIGNFAAASSPILIAELFARTSNWSIILVLFAGLYLAGAVCWAFVDCGKKIVPAAGDMF